MPWLTTYYLLPLHIVLINTSTAVQNPSTRSTTSVSKCLDIIYAEDTSFLQQCEEYRIISQNMLDYVKRDKNVVVGENKQMILIPMTKSSRIKHKKILAENDKKAKNDYEISEKAVEEAKRNIERCFIVLKGYLMGKNPQALKKTDSIKKFIVILTNTYKDILTTYDQMLQVSTEYIKRHKIDGDIINNTKEKHDIMCETIKLCIKELKKDFNASKSARNSKSDIAAAARHGNQSFYDAFMNLTQMSRAILDFMKENDKVFKNIDSNISYFYLIERLVFLSDYIIAVRAYDNAENVRKELAEKSYKPDVFDDTDFLITELFRAVEDAKTIAIRENNHAITVLQKYKESLIYFSKAITIMEIKWNLVNKELKRSFEKFLIGSTPEKDLGLDGKLKHNIIITMDQNLHYRKEFDTLLLTYYKCHLETRSRFGEKGLLDAEIRLMVIRLKSTVFLFANAISYFSKFKNEEMCMDDRNFVNSLPHEIIKMLGIVYASMEKIAEETVQYDIVIISIIDNIKLQTSNLLEAEKSMKTQNDKKQHNNNRSDTPKISTNSNDRINLLQVLDEFQQAFNIQIETLDGNIKMLREEKQERYNVSINDAQMDNGNMYTQLEERDATTDITTTEAKVEIIKVLVQRLIKGKELITKQAYMKSLSEDLLPALTIEIDLLSSIVAFYNNNIELLQINGHIELAISQRDSYMASICHEYQVTTLVNKNLYVFDQITDKIICRANQIRSLRNIKMLEGRRVLCINNSGKEITGSVRCVIEEIVDVNGDRIISQGDLERVYEVVNAFQNDFTGLYNIESADQQKMIYMQQSLYKVLCLSKAFLEHKTFPNIRIRKLLTNYKLQEKYKKWIVNHKITFAQILTDLTERIKLNQVRQEKEAFDAETAVLQGKTNEDTVNDTASKFPCDSENREINPQPRACLSQSSDQPSRKRLLFTMIKSAQTDPEEFPSNSQQPNGEPLLKKKPISKKLN